MKYERLTIKRENGFATVRNTTLQGLIDRLAELEDKIERGELISTVQDERSEQEIAFFVKHNAEVRKQAENAALRERLDKAVDKTIVSEMLAKYFDCPCNFSPLDEEMWAYCRDNCVDDNIECWIRVINKKCAELKGEEK